MKTNVFRNVLAFAMAAAIGVGFTSCKDDEVLKITDNNDDEWLVRYVNGIHCTYDEDNKLTSIDDGSHIYYVTTDGTITIAWADNNESNKAQITLNDDNHITKIEYSGIEYEDEKWDGTYNFNYIGERLQSYTATDKKENLDKDNQNRWTVSTTQIGASFTWANENLISWTESENEVTEYTNSNNKTYNKKNTYTYSYSDQAILCKQFPYFMGERLVVMGNSKISGLFSVLGLFGYGPNYLPLSCSITSERSGSGYSTTSTSTSNYTYSFTQNDNGTLNTETSYYNGSTNGTTYTYIYTPTRAGNVGTQSLKELVRNMRPHDSFKRNEQEQQEQ